MSDYVSVSGPLFDGRAEEALARGIVEARNAVAKAGVKLTQGAFADSIRVNTGRHIASIQVINESKVFTSHSRDKTYTMPIVVEDRATDTLVTSDNATYGPWLEGTGSRNLTTRFKGYQGFRRASQELDRVAQGIADDAISPYTEEMNA